MATIKQLIKQLQEIEDKDQTIIYQYFLADHFDLDGESPTARQFDQVAREMDPFAIWDDPANTLNDEICSLMFREREEI
jgi:hypothetical protein